MNLLILELRLSIQNKYNLAMDRISNSKLSESEQQIMIELYNEVFKKLSTD